MIESSKRFRWFGRNTIKVSVDGNSIMSGIPADSTTGGIARQLCLYTRPFEQHAYNNVAISGQNWDGMMSAATDIDNSWDSTKINILFVQEGTNQNGSSTAAQNATKTWQYVAARKAAHNWDAVIVGVPPPQYLGDPSTAQQTIDWNLKLDEYIQYLRRDYLANGVTALFDPRAIPGSPYHQSRYPNYLKATFFDTTVVNGISNDAYFVTETATLNQKIHPTVAGNKAMAPFLKDCLLRLHRR